MFVEEAVKSQFQFTRMNMSDLLERILMFHLFERPLNNGKSMHFDEAYRSAKKAQRKSP